MSSTGGRPTTYNAAIAEHICKVVATSDIGTATLCATRDDMPSKTCLYEWRFLHPEFNEMYKKAKIFQAEFLAESIDDIAHEKRYFFDSEGNERVDPGFTNDKRLRIDTRKWIASKLLPKAYGEKTTIETTSNSETESLKAELTLLRAKLAEQSKAEY